MGEAKMVAIEHLNFQYEFLLHNTFSIEHPHQLMRSVSPY